MNTTNLKRLRKASKLTQEDVAERLNVSRQTVAKWETGESLPDIDSCIALANLYGVTIDDMVSSVKDPFHSKGPKGKYLFGVVKIDKNLNLIFKIMKRGEKLEEALSTGNEKEIADMGLRYDLTLPLTRYYANNRAKLQNPFKVIQTDRVYRAERPQKGRLLDGVGVSFRRAGKSRGCNSMIRQDVIHTYSLQETLEPCP